MNFDVLILCGGRGTRFQEVFSDRPKALAPISGKPLIEILIDYYRQAGCRRFILATGHMSDQIEKYFLGRGIDAEIIISREPNPLGTGGAVKHAESKIRSENFLVINGDSHCPINIPDFCEFHLSKPKPVVSMVLTRPTDRTDVGTISINPATGAVTDFQEKLSAGTHVNAGVYLFHKKIFALLPPAKNLSLEFDVFPDLVGKGFYGYPTDRQVVDIGTRERYEEALKTGL